MKRFLFCVVILTYLNCFGAAESSQKSDIDKTAFDISRFIGIVGRETTPPMQHQIACCFTGSKLYTCLVAGPNLKTYFPEDIAQQLADYTCQHQHHNPEKPVLALKQAMDVVAHKYIAREALAKGITSTKFALMFVTTTHNLRICCLRQKTVPIKSGATIKLWTFKDDGTDVIVSGECDAQEHIQALIARKDPLVDQLRIEYLESADYDLALEIERDALIEYVREHAKAVTARTCTAIEGNKNLPPRTSAAVGDPCITGILMTCNLL